jgi:hypothetical protein
MGSSPPRQEGMSANFITLQFEATKKQPRERLLVQLL